MIPVREKTVVLGMSGGVDSSTAVYLLKEQGYRVIGLTMDIGISPTLTREAKAVAESFAIEHQVIDLREEFHSEVIEPFIEEYLNGRTPNPCVLCNRRIKFGKFFSEMEKLGADYLATGHYARIIENEGEFSLAKGRDDKKDQSYFLYGLGRENLSRILFPLGELTKDEVRTLAQKIGLSVAEKKDSQEICFLPDNDYRAFLVREKGRGFAPEGDFVDPEGKKLGRHEGLPFYTIGQRKGLGLALGYPAYVLSLNKKDNTVEIGTNEALFRKELLVKDNILLSAELFAESAIEEAEVKIRSTGKAEKATLTKLEDGRIRVEFAKPQRAITPGQSAVYYLHDIVLGGGIIE